MIANFLGDKRSRIEAWDVSCSNDRSIIMLSESKTLIRLY